MAVNLSPVLNWQQSDANSVILANGTIETYLAGSSTPATTFKDPAGLVSHSNPIELNVRGEPDSLIYLTAGVSYKFIRKDGTGNQIGQPLDGISGVNDVTATADQFIAFGGVATYISPNSFSLVGDQTSIFKRGLALKLLTSGGTVSAKILTSAYTTLTTITIQQATGVLDTGLTGTTPSYGLISSENNGLPSSIDYNIQNQSATAFTTTGTAPAFAVVTSPVYGTIINGKTAINVTFNANVANGAQPTLVVDAIAVKNIKQYDPAGNLINGRIRTNYEYKLIYDGTQYIILNPILGFVIDNTGYAGASITIGVGEKVTMDFTAQTSMAQRITCATNQIYKIYINGTSTTAAAGTAAILQVNNTNFAAGFDTFFDYASNSTPSSAVSNATGNGFRLDIGGCTPTVAEYVLETTTNKKRLRCNSIFCQVTGTNLMGNFVSAQIDTTTALTDVGTIIVPNAFTGTIVWERVR
jgi:hypothetical protein